MSSDLENILAVDGVDFIAVGPNDLSGSVGLLGQTNHPKVVDLLERIIKICRESNTVFFPSIGSGNIDNLKFWIERGTPMIALDVDIGHLTISGNNTLTIVKRIFKELPK